MTPWVRAALHIQCLSSGLRTLICQTSLAVPESQRSKWGPRIFNSSMGSRPGNQVAVSGCTPLEPAGDGWQLQRRNVMICSRSSFLAPATLVGPQRPDNTLAGATATYAALYGIICWRLVSLRRKTTPGVCIWQMMLHLHSMLSQFFQSAQHCNAVLDHIPELHSRKGYCISSSYRGNAIQIDHDSLYAPLFGLVDYSPHKGGSLNQSGHIFGNSAHALTTPTFRLTLS